MKKPIDGKMEKRGHGKKGTDLIWAQIGVSTDWGQACFSDITSTQGQDTESQT